MGAATRVWVDGWQMQCCGDRFAVGSTVRWTVRSAVDRDYLIDVLGETEASQIAATEEHHDENAEMQRFEGLVRSVAAVFCEYAPRPDDDGTHYPVRWSAVVVPRVSVDGREPETQSRRFVGYVVDLDLGAR